MNPFIKDHFTISYFVWKARKDKAGMMPVYIRSKQNSDKQIPYNTGVKVLAEQCTRTRNGGYRLKKNNKPARLIELEGKIKDTYRDLIVQGYQANLNDIVKHLNDARKPLSRSIIAWCEDYLASPSYNESQRRSVHSLKTNIEEFNPSLTFDNLTQPRIKAFFEHLTGNGVANNSQSKRLATLRNVAAHANVEIPHLRNYKLSYSTRDANKARLTWPEVKAIMNTPTETNLESVAKDAFLLACFSGLRISDILSLNKGELHDYHYERIQTKTNKLVLVTVHERNEELFRKYIGTGIKFSRQRLSDALDDVLKRSESLDKKIIKKQFVGNNTKETKLAKWEEISFHSGRRFYSRLLSDLSLAHEIVRDELGHGYKNVTDLYAGSTDHVFRVSQVRKAIDTMETKLEELALMKVA